jgi:hypothetical protein
MVPTREANDSSPAYFVGNAGQAHVILVRNILNLLMVAAAAGGHGRCIRAPFGRGL